MKTKESSDAASKSEAHHCFFWCYFWRSDPLFLSRSSRQEGGGACSEKGFSACSVCSSFAVHLLHKSVLTAWLAPNGQLFFSYLTGLTAVAASLYIYIKAYAPALSRRQGRGVLFDPMIPFPVVSCRICSFYIKFHRRAQFKPYSMPFDVFYSNLKYSRTILTRSVKNRLSCRQAGGQPGLILRRP